MSTVRDEGARGSLASSLILVAVGLSLLALSCADEHGTSAVFIPHEAPSIVGDGTLSLPEAHEGPSAIDIRTRAFYFTRSDSTFSVSRVFRVLPGSSEPPVLAPFSTSSYDAGAAFAPNGPTILFTSKRPTGDPSLPDDWNLWSVLVGAEEATPLPSPVNSEASECCAAFAPDGSFLFSSNRLGSWDIYRAQPTVEGAFEVSHLNGSINSEHDEWPSYVLPDGTMILFSSIRPGGPGGDDIFAGCPEAGLADQWRAHRLPAPVNSQAYEDGAMLTPDGRTFLWSSWRSRPTGEQRADIYAVAVEATGLPACSGRLTP